MAQYQTDAFTDTPLREFYPSALRERRSSINTDARLYFRAFEFRIRHTYYTPGVAELAEEMALCKAWIAARDWDALAASTGAQTIPGLSASYDLTSGWSVTAGSSIWEYGYVYRVTLQKIDGSPETDYDIQSNLARTSLAALNPAWASDAVSIDCDAYWIGGLASDLFYGTTIITADELRALRVESITDPTDARFSLDLDEWIDVTWAPSGSATQSSSILNRYQIVVTPPTDEWTSLSYGNRAAFTTKERP